MSLWEWIWIIEDFIENKASINIVTDKKFKSKRGSFGEQNFADSSINHLNEFNNNITESVEQNNDEKDYGAEYQKLTKLETDIEQLGVFDQQRQANIKLKDFMNEKNKKQRNRSFNEHGHNM